MERIYSPGTALPREAAFMKQIGQRLQLLMTTGYPKKNYLQAEHWHKKKSFYQYTHVINWPLTSDKRSVKYTYTFFY